MTSFFVQLGRATSLCLVLLFPLTAQAKDLRNRLALGFDTQLGNDAAISIRYGLPTANPAINFQAELNVGLSTYAASPSATVGGRLLYGIVAEDNLNLYVGGGAGLLNSDGAQLLRVQPLVAVDYFLFGLENLGLTAGWGLNIDAGDSGSGITTTGAILGGMHYWF